LLPTVLVVEHLAIGSCSYTGKGSRKSLHFVRNAARLVIVGEQSLTR
jgi:hypothetical protein